MITCPDKNTLSPQEIRRIQYQRAVTLSLSPPDGMPLEQLTTEVVAGVGLTQAELDYMIGGYYQARGWTEDGMIPESKLAELGLSDLLPHLAGAALPE